MIKYDENNIEGLIFINLKLSRRKLSTTENHDIDNYKLKRKKWSFQKQIFLSIVYKQRVQQIYYSDKLIPRLTTI